MRGRLRLSLIVTGALVGLLSAGPAWAHTATVHYAPKWSWDDRDAVTIYNDSNLTGKFLTRAIVAAKTWDAANTTLDFDYLSQSNLSRNVCDSDSRRKNLIYKASIDGAGKTLAITETCFSGSDILRFTMRFDTAESWYTSGTLPVPAGKSDLASVATHEFGHATGWRAHIGDAGLCENNSNQETMCSSHYSGSSQQRSLGTHDLHTFDAAY